MSDRSAVWDAVHEERRKLAQDLEGLTPEEWARPSLCHGWSVHDVVAHLVDSARTTRLGFVRQMAGAGLDFDRANARGVERHRADDPRHTLAAFSEAAGRTDTPPGPLVTRLVEAYVHGEDVRRPLGIGAAYPVDHVLAALAYVVRTRVRFGGGRERADGLRLCPSDSRQQLGEGPEVHGTAISLLLAVSGRPCAAGELAGPGATLLLARR